MKKETTPIERVLGLIAVIAFALIPVGLIGQIWIKTGWKLPLTEVILFIFSAILIGVIQNEQKNNRRAAWTKSEYQAN